MLCVGMEGDPPTPPQCSFCFQKEHRLKNEKEHNKPHKAKGLVMIRYGHSQAFRLLLATKVFPFAAKCGMIELAKKSKLLDKLEFDGGFI